MDIFFVPTSNVLINTFLRSVMILGFERSWYEAYWGAVIHDAISLLLVKPYV